MNTPSENWVEPPEPAKPLPPPPPIVVASDMQDVGTPPATPPPPPAPPTLFDRIYDAVRNSWTDSGRKPTSLYLGVFEHAELVKRANDMANFTITDPQGRKPQIEHLFEFNGMRVFKVDVLSHVGVGL